MGLNTYGVDYLWGGLPMGWTTYGVDYLWG